MNLMHRRRDGLQRLTCRSASNNVVVARAALAFMASSARLEPLRMPCTICSISCVDCCVR
jgi:hypothetical protein